MMTKTTPQIETKYVEEMIKHKLGVETTRLVEDAKKQLEEKTPEIVASIIVDIMGMVTMKELENRFIFTIRKNND